MKPLIRSTRTHGQTIPLHEHQQVKCVWTRTTAQCYHWTTTRGVWSHNRRSTSHFGTASLEHSISLHLRCAARRRLRLWSPSSQLMKQHHIWRFRSRSRNFCVYTSATTSPGICENCILDKSSSFIEASLSTKTLIVELFGSQWETAHVTWNSRSRSSVFAERATNCSHLATTGFISNRDATRRMSDTFTTESGFRMGQKKMHRKNSSISLGLISSTIKELCASSPKQYSAKKDDNSANQPAFT